MLEFEQLEAFVTTVKCGSFMAASKYLSISKTRVSELISNLEIDLDFTLFDRSGRNPALTHEGEQMYQHAVLLIHQKRRMLALSESIRVTGVAKLRLGLGRLIPFSVIEPSISRMLKAFPNTQLQIVRDTDDTLLKKLEIEQLELCIQLIRGGELAQTMDLYELVPLEWSYVCSPDSDLLEYDCINQDILSRYRQIVCSAAFDIVFADLLGIASTQIWEVAEQQDVVQMVEQDFGFALLPTVLAEERIAFGTLTRFNPDFRNETIPIHTPVEMLVRPSISSNDALSFLVNELRNSPESIKR